MNASSFLVLTVLSFSVRASAIGQDCVMDQYAEWTIDSLLDPTMRAEVLSLYPTGLLEETSTVELIALPGRANCHDRAEFKGNDITVVIEGAPFDTAKHTFGYDRSQQVPFLCNIDGLGFWGTDGGMPRREIKGVNVTMKGKMLNVPKRGYTNLYEPNFCDTYPGSKDAPISIHASCRLSKDRERLYIHMMNSDGAGGYLVTWIFQNGRYWGRVVEHGF